ncbi:MAG: amidohydrolase family protein [Candidatus Heimdallarchaeota archaeon]
MVDLLILHGTLLTMDHQRRIIHDGAIAIKKERICDVGQAVDLETRYDAKRVVDATGKVVMPGLIDTHGHAGHSLLKTVAENQGDDWIPIMETFYKEATTPDFWYVDGLLAALERIKFGTTCGLSYIGSCARTDESVYALKHYEGAKKIGIRDVVAIGPGRPPYPNEYIKWHKETSQRIYASFEDNLKVTEEIARKLKNTKDEKVDVVLSPPSLTVGSLTAAGKVQDFPDALEKIENMKQVMKKGKLKLHTHAYSAQIKFADEKLDILGPHVSLAHCTGLSDEEIQILARKDVKVCHSPSARSIILSRCPVIELLDAGVTVAISTDGSAPDRTFDLFKELRQAMSVQRHFFKDENIMPPGKALEMVTVDAARTLGYEDDLGSLETGKIADIILIDMLKPHLIPMFMIPHRIAYEVSGQDVDTVIVNGEVLMENRQLSHIIEFDILNRAQEEAEKAIARGQLKQFLEIPEKFWGQTRY